MSTLCISKRKTTETRTFPYPTLPNELKAVVHRVIPLNSLPTLFKVNKSVKNYQLQCGFNRRINSVLIKSNTTEESEERSCIFHVKLDDRLWFHLSRKPISISHNNSKTVSFCKNTTFWTIFNTMRTIKSLQIIFERSLFEEHHDLAEYFLPWIRVLAEFEIRAPFLIVESLLKRFNPTVLGLLALDFGCKITPQVQSFLNTLVTRPIIRHCCSIFWTGKQFPLTTFASLNFPILYWTYKAETRANLTNFLCNLLGESSKLNDGMTLIVHLTSHHFERYPDFHYSIFTIFERLRTSAEIERFDGNSEELWNEIEDLLRRVKVFGEVKRKKETMHTLYQRRISAVSWLIYAYRQLSCHSSQLIIHNLTVNVKSKSKSKKKVKKVKLSKKSKGK